MSDGPHCSLPMRGGWKRLAEFGDNSAFAPAEVAEAIIPALAADCYADMTPEFLHAFTGVFNSLFPFQTELQLENLREIAGNGLGQTVIDYASQIAARGGPSENTAVEAVTQTLNDRSARGVHRSKNITTANRRKVVLITSAPD